MKDVLSLLAQAKRELDEEHQDFQKMIVWAHSEGLSLRAIAEAAGMSHESVRRLIRTDQT